jgi:hypothetical protein
MVGVELLMRFEESGLGSTLEAVANTFFGLSFDAGRVTPYVQVKNFRTLDEISSNDTLVAVGIRF